MKSITENQLKDWVEGGQLDDEVYFVVVKMNGCGKCEVLVQQKDKVFKAMVDKAVSYIYHPSQKWANEFFKKLDLMAVPVILFRYKDGNDWKIHVIGGHDHIDLECIFDAINEKDWLYFGYDDKDNVVETDSQYPFNRLLRLIYGEVDPAEVRDLNLLKRSASTN